MTPVAQVVIAFSIILVVAFLTATARGDRNRRALKSEIDRGNLKRKELGRRLGVDFYSHEADNGSLSWRRVSSD